jgi:hypothetical protein
MHRALADGQLRLVKRLAVEERSFQVTNGLTPFTISLYSRNDILISKEKSPLVVYGKRKLGISPSPSRTPGANSKKWIWKSSALFPAEECARQDLCSVAGRKRNSGKEVVVAAAREKALVCFKRFCRILARMVTPPGLIRS